MKRILIAEDDVALSSIFKMKLEREDFNVEIAANGIEALGYLKKELPDLILLDIIMPKMDGFQFLMHKNKDENYKDIPVIIMSNCAQQSDIESGLKLGAKEYVVKSDQGIDDILKKVQTMMNS